MLEFALVTYILGVVMFGGLFGIATWRVGGFQAYADFFNKFAARDEEDKITSNYVQWLLAIWIFAWPAAMVLAYITIRAARK